MMINHLITHNYSFVFILDKLKDLKPKIEILDCYFDNIPIVNRYSFFNNFEKEEIKSENGIFMFSIGYKTQECYNYALELFNNKKDIITIYKETFSKLVCDCIGETLDIFTLNKTGPHFIDTFGLNDNYINRIPYSTNYNMLIADTIVGNLIAGNNLVIANSTNSNEATFYVDANGARLTNSNFTLNNTAENSSIVMNSNDGIRLTKNGTTVFQASMNGIVTIQGLQSGDYVTKNMLSTANSTVINGNNITTGRITDRTGQKFVLDFDTPYISINSGTFILNADGGLSAKGTFTCGDDRYGYAVLSGGDLTVYKDTQASSSGMGLRIYKGTAGGGNIDLYNYNNQRRTISLEGGNGYVYAYTYKMWDSNGNERTFYCADDGTVRWQ